MNELRCIWDAKAQLGEGALWHEQEQALYWVDIINSQLHRFKVTPGGDETRDSWHFAGSISSVAPCKEGGLLATFKDGVSHINVSTNEVSPVCTLEQELPDNRFNDGCADTRGNLWFGSMDNNQTNASGSFYRLNSDAQVERLSQLGDICITNGPTFSQDGQWLYYTDTLAGKIFRARLSANGAIGTSELHIHFGEADGYPDGMCCDVDGYLWVCHWGAGRVSRFDPDGNVEQAISLPVPNVTKCAFGGPNLNTLYITTAAVDLSAEQLEQTPLAGGLFAIELAQQGFSYPALSIGR